MTGAKPGFTISFGTPLMNDKAELRKTIKARLAALAPETLSAAGSTAARHLERIPRWNSFPSALAFFSMKDEIDTRPIMEAILKAGKALFVPRVEGESLGFYRVGRDSAAGNLFDSAIDHVSDGPRRYREPEANPALSLKPDDFPILVITPGLAFDRRLNRLGRGRGYYDRFFAALNSGEAYPAASQYTAVGLCLDCQLVDQVPVSPWDKKVNLLLTESGLAPALGC